MRTRFQPHLWLLLGLLAVPAVVAKTGLREPSPRSDKGKASPGKPEAEASPGRKAAKVRLKAPGSAHGVPAVSLPGSPPVKAEALEAQALHFRSNIYLTPADPPNPIGLASRGARIAAKARVYGSGCKGGKWYSVDGGGYVCTSRGFLVGSKLGSLGLPYRMPDLQSPLPYRYAKVVRPSAERMYRLPTTKEDELIAQAAEGDGSFPDVVEKRMKGIYFLALDELTSAADRSFFRTVRGRYVREEDLDPRATPPMRGEWLSQKNRLPIAFVFGKDRPLFELQDSELQVVGVAEKHARFRPTRTVEHDGRRFLATPRGLLVARDHLRVVERLKRPPGISKGEHWIHVDLSSQTLAAYEGEKPVFATVVSSGKKGYEPPTGLFHVYRKLITATMNGADPSDGWYEVEEVPWTMYYRDSFALHGTYWHNDFGKPRSHGCTNIAPIDARWLFYWSAPELPVGWHAKEARGTAVWFTT